MQEEVIKSTGRSSPTKSISQTTVLPTVKFTEDKSHWWAQPSSQFFILALYKLLGIWGNLNIRDKIETEKTIWKKQIMHRQETITIISEKSREAIATKK